MSRLHQEIAFEDYNCNALAAQVCLQETSNGVKYSQCAV